MEGYTVTLHFWPYNFVCSYWRELQLQEMNSKHITHTQSIVWVMKISYRII